MKPPSGVIVALKVSGLFPVWVVFGPVTVKSQPVPDSGTIWGLPAALSVIVRFPLSGPVVAGVKVTLMVQVFPGAMLDKVLGLMGQAVAPVLVSAKPAEAAIELMVSGPVPLLVSVTGIAALVVVTICGLKGTGLGEKPTVGTEFEPVPVRLTLRTFVLFWPPLVIVAVMTSVADSAPVTEGV